MVDGAIDLHMRYSQIRILDEAGTVLCDRRVVTSADSLTRVFAGHGQMRILLETGTESEWVAQALEAAGQVSAAIGLVPREDSSAERHHRGHITKAGPRELRALCIQAAWACWRGAGGAPLRPWVDRVAARRGRRVAVVALARRLSRIMYAVWRDGSSFDATKFAAT